LAEGKFQEIPIDDIKVQKHNVRKHNIHDGIDDLAASIKRFGLLQPITVFFDSDEKRYVILAGQRRLNAHFKLNEENPGGEYTTILARIIAEPETREEKQAMSLAENITQVQMTNTDLVTAVTDLYNVYGSYEKCQEKFGITKYMVDKFVRLARLPKELKDAITNGQIHSNPKTSENSAIRAVDALNWRVGGDVSTDDVLELAMEYGKGEIDVNILDGEARKGGSIKEIAEGARKKSSKDVKIKLSTDTKNNLDMIAQHNGEKPEARATGYVVKGIKNDLKEFQD
jgi:ParB/RepB/Spo0J family partition protein